MKLKWLGHASFLITSDSGVRIITDPYHAGGPLSYGEINDPADVVTVSHEHGDHNNSGAVPGNPEVIRRSATVKGMSFNAVPLFHDEEGGKQRGKDTVFCFDVDGIRVCHMGDIGHQPDDAQAAEIGKVDVMLVPVGGFYTIDAAGATRLVERLKPRVVVPMHYKTAKCTYPIATADEFLKGKKVKRMDSAEVQLKAKDLPAETQIIVLKHAM